MTPLKKYAMEKDNKFDFAAHQKELNESWKRMDEMMDEHIKNSERRRLEFEKATREFIEFLDDLQSQLTK